MVDGVGQIFREEMIFQTIEDAVEDVVKTQHAMGFAVSETFREQLGNFQKWNRPGRKYNWGKGKMYITIDEFT